MFGECHAHVLMDGINYRQAVERHKERPEEKAVRKCLGAYREAGISFVRDGGDTVSYTHLDVYKRQELKSSTFWLLMPKVVRLVCLAAPV